MAGRTQHQYPDDEAIIKACVDAGGFTNGARALGYAPPTLRNHCQKRGLMEKIHEACKVKVEAQEPSEIDEAELLRQRNQELEREVRRRHKDDIETERWLRRLEVAIPSVKPKVKPPRASKVRQDDGHEMALLFSDTHAGEVVSSEETLGMNEYNWQIMLRRMRRLQEAVISFQQHRPYPVKKLHVWMLGDMLSGSIHDELANTNEMGDAQAVAQFAADTATWLEGFVPHFPGPISVKGVVGNHPRRTKKPSAKRVANSDDWLAYKMIELYHRDNDAFEFDFPNAGFAVATVAERWRMLLMHGDGIRSTMPGVPWGGVVRRITVLEQQFAQAKQPIDFVSLGHFHTANALDGVGVKTFMNGSVKGLDEYSLKAFGSGRHPSQVLLTFHPRRGLTDVSYLDLEDTEPASARVAA